VSTIRVLVVEDVPELSRLLEMTFELDERFVPVGTATSSSQAIDIAREQQPDAVVLDMSIDGSSDDLLPELCALLPDARIVIFTGSDDEHRRQATLAAGASAYVVKGGDLDALLDALAEHPAQGGHSPEGAERRQ
jgi:DNA-binding NarL/FixJ family response regulator